jgi:hypothetical protein
MVDRSETISLWAALLITVGPFLLAFAALAWLESIQPKPVRRRKPRKQKDLSATTPQQDFEQWRRSENAYYERSRREEMASAPEPSRGNYQPPSMFD